MPTYLGGNIRCDDEVLEYICPEGQYIRITSASYGRLQNEKCIIYDDYYPTGESVHSGYIKFCWESFNFGVEEKGKLTKARFEPAVCVLTHNRKAPLKNEARKIHPFHLTAIILYLLYTYLKICLKAIFLMFCFVWSLALDNFFTLETFFLTDCEYDADTVMHRLERQCNNKRHCMVHISQTMFAETGVSYPQCDGFPLYVNATRECIGKIGFDFCFKLVY